MNDYTLNRVKIPPTLRLYISTPQSLGDNPTAKITRPKNLAQPTNVSKTADKQYMIVFDASSAGESVDVTLTAAAFSFKSLFAFLTLSFWLGMLPRRDFFTLAVFKTFAIRSVLFSGALFFVLVGLELSGVETRTSFSKWLDTLTMAENTGEKIKDLVGWSHDDPFFQSEDARMFKTRTGKDLDKVYLVMTATDENGAYRLLVRKNFLSADDLDSAENICEKEMNAEIPSVAIYQLLSSDVRSDLTFAFAEWTSTAYGFISDDYGLYLLPEHSSTWQMGITEIRSSKGPVLDDLARTYDFIRDTGMDDEDFQNVLIQNFNLILRLPLETDVQYNDGIASFYLDADDEANFRCVRRLPSIAQAAL